MKLKIYIAGKVTGLPLEPTALKFKTAQDKIESLGFETVNPIELINNPNEVWETAMKKCISALALCDAIFMLPCYKDSKGASIELKMAGVLGMPIYHEINEIEWS